MNARLASVLRILRRGLAVVATLVVIAVVAATFAIYLAATGRSLPLLRRVVTHLGTLVQGQRTEHMTLDVRVAPDTAHLTGTATLTVRSLEAGRQRFYFLLNDGLRVRNARVTGGTAPAFSAYRLWLLTAIDVGAPMAKDATVDLSFDYDGPIASSPFGGAPSIVNPQQILLGVDAFWYPSDLQSFFTADVSITVPKTMTVAHNAAQATRIERGDLQVVHWTSERPIAGMSLVAGPYELTSQQADGNTYQLYLPHGVQLDRTRVLDAMARANRTFEATYGASGFKQVTMFVGDNFRRAFNDGSGLVGVALHYFRTGDYGFGITAHEIAHNWWGGTVAERWLAPGTGGEWIVEGFAEFSSLIATEAAYGRDALTRRLAGEFFDPARQGVVARMSVLDNALNEASARDTIYRKGAYVAFMLRQVLGDETYFTALRRFLDRFRYQQATDDDLQQVLQETTQQDLIPYFTDWVHSNKLADLSLDGSSGSDLTVTNLGAAVIPGKLDLWTFKKSGGEPVHTTVQIGDKIPLDADADYAVLDPQLDWADVERENNRYPRRNDPVYVASSSRGETAITRGEAFPWVRAAVSSVDSTGRTLHTWDLTRGLAASPVWSPDAGRIIASHATADTAFPAVVTLASDGAQRTVGYGNAPAGDAGGAILIARGDRIVRLGADGATSTVVQRCAHTLDAPLPSPDGQLLLYTAAAGGRQELRVVGADGGNDRLVLALDRDRLVYRWSPNSARLYAIVGGSWDWQIWQVPLGTEPVETLVASAAAITDLALSPSGSELAFTAAPALDYPGNRRQLYIMNLTDRSVHPVDVPQADLSSLTWMDAENVLVVAATVDSGQPWILPEARTLKRVRAADGSVEDVQ
jgi:Tol biopolymer transport system component